MFYQALKIACQKHNLIKAIYNYSLNMPWYDSDCFEDYLVLEMVKKGVIEKDNDYHNNTYDESKYMRAKYKLIEYHKNYNVVEYGQWFDDDREGLEEIYMNSKRELIWLD